MGGKFSTRKPRLALNNVGEARNKHISSEADQIRWWLSTRYDGIDVYGIGSAFRKNPPSEPNDVDLLVSLKQIYDLHNQVYIDAETFTRKYAATIKKEFVAELIEIDPDLTFHHMSSAAHMTRDGVQVDINFAAFDADIDDLFQLFDVAENIESTHLQIIRQYAVRTFNPKWGYNVLRGVTDDRNNLMTANHISISDNLGVDFRFAKQMLPWILKNSPELYHDQLTNTLANLKNKPITIGTLLGQLND